MNMRRSTGVDMVKEEVRERRNACERERVVRVDAMRNAQGGGEGGDE